MRIPALFLLVSLCPGLAAAQEWCAEPICARYEGTDLVRIRAPGRFEITFTKREGFGQEVYDLQDDPGRLHDLSAVLEENGILWTKLLEVGDGSSYYANNATDLEIHESGGVRVQASHSGKHHRYGIPGEAWNDLGFTQTFTVYATGEIYIDYALIASRDISLGQFTLIVKTTSEWGQVEPASALGEAQCIGLYGTAPPYGATATPFAMESTNGPQYFADMLLVMYEGLYNATYWNEGYPGHDFRCALDVYGSYPTMLTGTTHVPAMMRLAQDMNDAASASKYANAYRDPDALSVLQGALVLTDPGDRDGDGFNEEEGAYVVERQAAQPVEVLLHASPSRMNPAFEIVNWNQPVPQGVWIDDVLAVEGTDYRASLRAGDLILQLLGERDQDTLVRVEGVTQVPALPWLAGLALAAALCATGARRLARSS